MKKSLIAISFLFSILSSCESEKKFEKKQEYLRWIGDVELNAQNDELSFKVCNGDDKILQYFNLGEGPVYNGEKSTILKTYKSKYKPVPNKDQNGFIRIRFIVNCEGKAGRFRVLQSDYNYQEIKFDRRIATHLVEITKGIVKWQILYKREIPVDYYMYLIFKITDGKLTEILP